MYCQTVVSGRQEGAQRIAVGLRRIFPIGPDRIPAVAQPLLIGVSVLRDDGGDALRVPRRQPEARRRAIVEHIDREAIEPDDLSEAVDDPRDIVECVSELAAVRHVGLAEPGKIGRDDVKSVRELRDEVTEHMAGAGKTVQQQERWRVPRPCLAIEDVEPVDIDLPEADLEH